MRATPIPDAEIWEGATRRVIAPPDGDLTNPDIAPVEVLIDRVKTGLCMSARCELEGDDLEKLRAGGVVWVSFYGTQLVPFSVDVAGAVSPEQPSLRVDVDMTGAAPSFQAWVTGVPHDEIPTFIGGCVEALQEMMRRHEPDPAS
jgi:hypothetical protein